MPPHTSGLRDNDLDLRCLRPRARWIEGSDETIVIITLAPVIRHGAANFG